MISSLPGSWISIVYNYLYSLLSLLWEKVGIPLFSNNAEGIMHIERVGTFWLSSNVEELCTMREWRHSGSPAMLRNYVQWKSGDILVLQQCWWTRVKIILIVHCWFKNSGDTAYKQKKSLCIFLKWKKIYTKFQNKQIEI